MVPWKYSDWMGWHEHGDGNLFLGLNVEQGRVKDEGGVNMKTLLRTLADAPYNLNMMLTPTQSIIIQGIGPSMKQEIEDVVHAVRSCILPLIFFRIVLQFSFCDYRDFLS